MPPTVEELAREEAAGIVAEAEQQHAEAAAAAAAGEIAGAACPPGAEPVRVGAVAGRLPGPPARPRRRAAVSRELPATVHPGRHLRLYRRRHFTDRAGKALVDYTLDQLVPESEWTEQRYRNFQALPGAGKHAPEDVDLAGLEIDGHGGVVWVIADRNQRRFIRAGRDGQPPAPVESPAKPKRRARRGRKEKSDGQ